MSMLTHHILDDEFDYSGRLEKAAIELYKATRDFEHCVDGALTRLKNAMQKFRDVAPQAEKQWRRGE